MISLLPLKTSMLIAGLVVLSLPLQAEPAERTANEDSSAEPAKQPPNPEGPESVGVRLVGAGDDSLSPLCGKWSDRYRNKSGKIDFRSVGSSVGFDELLVGTADFAFSDHAPGAEQVKAFQDKYGFGVLQFPAVVNAVVPIYNVPGVRAKLNFTPQALVGIFLGRITRWNDPAIAEANKGVELPSTYIEVTVYSGRSNATATWSDFLSRASDEWKFKLGKGTSVNWPVGVGGKDNEGVAGLIGLTPNSIGYIELGYAEEHDLLYGSVRNPGGDSVKAGVINVSTPAAAPPETALDKFNLSLTDAPGNQANTISSFTWLIVPAKFSDPSKRNAIKEFLIWSLADGQDLARALGYRKLPKELVVRAQEAIAQID